MVARVLVGDFMTLDEIARIKGSTVGAIRNWMKRHPELVECHFVGNTIVCKLSSFEKYQRSFK